MEWGEEQRKEAEKKVVKNSLQLVSEPLRGQRVVYLVLYGTTDAVTVHVFVFSAKYECEAAEYWDTFYQQHQNR